ncbi:helix-turn-helix transcriptional regulator [Thiofilum flexile]|uniref:helix-turn-helix transcriptional regulator n=1 Tax=Thiofilum flexile TaxID=125627 RepID=UPI00036C3A22|nr:AlpA family phage regulatory protein [Thiofilum flexile]
MSLLPPRKKQTIKAPTLAALNPAPLPPAPMVPSPIVTDPIEKMLRLDDVIAMTGISKSLIYQLMAEGQFPKAIKLTPKLSVWRQADVQAFLKLKIQQAIKAGAYQPFQGATA